MIITLKGANFSANNIGKISTYNIYVKTGTGATYDGPEFVNKGAAFSGTIIFAAGYEVGSAGVTVTMNGADISDCYDAATGTITIAEVTNYVHINVPTKNTNTGAEDTGSNPTGVVLVDDVTDVTLGGGSYGSGGIMFGLQTNFASGTYISHIDLLACAGATYKNPTAAITTGEIVIYQVDTSGVLKSVLASVSSATSFVSDTEETSGSHIYRITIDKTLLENSNIAVKLTPSDTSSAPTAAYAKGTSSNLGKGYMGSVKGIGESISATQSGYFLPCVIYG